MSDPLKELVVNKTLTIDLSEEYKIKIEEPQELEKSFFADIYKNAANAVREIIIQTEKKLEDIKDPFLNQHQDYNNIIAFCGERGTGKSSAMISFAQSLLKIDKKEAIEFYGKEHKVTERRYKTLKVIDPSLFEEDENIFEVILAQLFSSFEIALKEKEKDTDIDQKRKLLEQFEKVYENLQTIKKNGQKYDGEALETLSKLACGANLRENFKELINRYLKFITKDDEEKNNYLIIPIDDFDLNVKYAAEMAEQIRKYLMIPRVVVLIALKIEQLADAKEQQVRKDFDFLIKAKSLFEDPRKITSDYILKLIPTNRRLNLPSLKITAKNSILEIIKRNNNNNNEEFDKKPVSIENCILTAINKKFGLIFLPKKEENHLLIPSDLRKLKEFAKLIYSEDYSSSIDKFNAFEEFIFINIFAEKIYAPYYEILKELRTIDDYNINKYLIDAITKRQISSYIENNKKEPDHILTAVKFSNLKTDIQKLLDKRNQCFNITLADVLYFISAFDDYFNDFETYNFVVAIKIYYSIRLYKLTKELKQYDRAQIIFGDSPITELRDDISLIPSNRHFQILNIDEDFNTQLKKIPTSIQPNIERFNFYISYFGELQNKRFVTERPYYCQEIVFNNNIQNRRKCQFNLFSFIGLSINPNIVYERFGEIKIDENSISFRKDIFEWMKKYSLSFPIYSIDLIEIVFKKEFRYLDFPNDINKFEECKVIIAEIRKRLEKATKGLFNQNELLNSFIESPFCSLFAIEDEAAYFNSFFSNIPDEKSQSDETIPKTKGIKYILDLINSAGHKNSNTLGKAIKNWAKGTLNELEHKSLSEKIETISAKNTDAGNLKKEIKKYLNSLIDEQSSHSN